MDDDVSFLRDQVEILQSHISILEKDMVDKIRRNNELIMQVQKYRLGYTYYKLLQEAILSDENILGEWRRFLTVCRLSFDHDIAGLTS